MHNRFRGLAGQVALSSPDRSGRTPPEELRLTASCEPGFNARNLLIVGYRCFREMSRISNGVMVSFRNIDGAGNLLFAGLGSGYPRFCQINRLSVRPLVRPNTDFIPFWCCRCGDRPPAQEKCVRELTARVTISNRGPERRRRWISRISCIRKQSRRTGQLSVGWRGAMRPTVTAGMICCRRFTLQFGAASGPLMDVAAADLGSSRSPQCGGLPHRAEPACVGPARESGRSCIRSGDHLQHVRPDVGPQ